MSSPQSTPAFELLPRPNGLHSNMSPNRARELICDAGLYGFNEDQIMSHLRNSAISLYNHEKLTQRYQSRLSIGAENIASFLCAALGEHYTPNMPGILYSSQLPYKSFNTLGAWEGVYYALYAEVQILYADIQAHFESELGNGRFVLHRGGNDGTAINRPFTALDLAERLDTMWDLLTDPRLIGPLDIALRYDNLCRSDELDMEGDNFAEYYSKLDREERNTILGHATGMKDPSSATPETVLGWLAAAPSPLSSSTTSHWSHAGGMEVQAPTERRGRSASNNLAFVPEGNPAHLSRRGTTKDPFPTDFYGDGQRYPAFRPAAPPHPAPAVSDGAGVPHRKPLPPPAAARVQSPPPPEPDFIAPRPALKQRYVSAGGDLPLSERPELEGFALPAALTAGASVGREEFLRSLPSSSPPKTSTEESRPSEEEGRKGFRRRFFSRSSSNNNNKE